MPQTEVQDAYLELMKLALTDFLYLERSYNLPARMPRRKKFSLKRATLSLANAVAGTFQYEIGVRSRRTYEEVKALRLEGKDWPSCADTMVGMARLNNLQECIHSVVENRVEGDLIETGVWRGGATIFMRAVLKALGERNRTVWVADSFEGLPPPSDEYPADAGDRHHLNQDLQIGLEEVQKNFAKYGLLDEQVQFLKGWFKDTLPTAPVRKLSVLRLDGDMYESTMDALDALYHKLSPGGFLIVDDYGAVPACAQAITDFRDRHQIRDEIHKVDWTCVYWQKCA